MHEKPSQLKLAANRRNAQKSTGPKTPEGKAKVAGNGIRHGLCAMDVVLRAGPNAESPADFEELVEQLKADMRPVDVVERGLVMRVAIAMWRMRRAYRYEVGAIGELVSAAEAAGPADPQVCKLDRAIGNAKSEVDLWRYFLARAQTNPPPEDKRSCERRAVALRTAAHERNIPDSAINDPEMIPKLIEILREGLQAREEYLSALRQQREELIEEQEDLPALVQSLPDAAAVNKLTRYENMLDRQLHRALSEFRRYRAARAMMNTHLACIAYSQPETYAPQPGTPQSAVDTSKSASQTAMPMEGAA